MFNRCVRKRRCRRLLGRLLQPQADDLACSVCGALARLCAGYGNHSNVELILEEIPGILCDDETAAVPEPKQLDRQRLVADQKERPTPEE